MSQQENASENQSETTATSDESGLKAKNNELLAKLKKQQDQIDELMAAKEEAETEAAEKSGDIEKIKKQLESKHQKEIENLTRERDAALNDIKAIRVDNEIKSTIASLGIKTEFVPAVEALLHRHVEYADGLATIEGKAISDWAKEWSNGDGAVYRPASNNSGAGITGNDSARPSPAGFTRENINARIGEFGQLAMKDPAQAKAIAQQIGRPDLAQGL